VNFLYKVHYLKNPKMHPGNVMNLESDDFSATACPFLEAPAAVVQRPTKFQTQLCQLVVEVG